MADPATPASTPRTGVVVPGGASGPGTASARALAGSGRQVALYNRADPSGSTPRRRVTALDH
ncbi:hypothetical protein [Actinomadura napierensis]|uniref:NAD(P)-dependent oxidoreductase n=1 Tax=Actinomadura napierensis TaxID=267854 RepID=A0ABP5LCF1_9ACTN